MHGEDKRAWQLPAMSLQPWKGRARCGLSLCSSRLLWDQAQGAALCSVPNALPLSGEQITGGFGPLPLKQSHLGLDREAFGMRLASWRGGRTGAIIE